MQNSKCIERNTKNHKKGGLKKSPLINSFKVAKGDFFVKI